uniref:Lebocin-like protein n=1 Tax=Antheraea pernyi TaxID=7119 RepID=B2CZ94_ANTPE|nr:lebocin-like protein [Antheraea pernyi]
MFKFTLILVIASVLFAQESSCLRFIQVTFRPPPERPIVIRKLREAADEPLWLYKGEDNIHAPATGDHPSLPSIMDDVKLDPNRRYTRSVHPEHHHREVRSLPRNYVPIMRNIFPLLVPPFNPIPITLPRDPERFPIYAYN